jgi:hypothetical protein
MPADVFSLAVTKNNQAIIDLRFRLAHCAQNSWKSPPTQKVLCPFQIVHVILAP